MLQFIEKKPERGAIQKGLTHENNFDILRLIAALQVVADHYIRHFGLIQIDSFSLLHQAIAVFPGVSVFFFISGYLVTASAESNVATPRKYFVSRALRIFPALWVCTGLTAISLGVIGQLADVPLPSLLLWLFQQVTIFQFINPDYFRDFATGVINGSLWTIPVEITFYVVVFYFSRFAFGISRLWKTFIVVILSALSYAVYLYCAQRGGLMEKILYNSIAAHFWRFGFGMIAFYFRTDAILLSRNFLPVSLGLILILAIEPSGIARAAIVDLPALHTLLLSVVTIGCAYTLPALSQSILHGNDVSYGVYIYHMPIGNLFIYYHLNSVSLTLIAAAAALAIATLSWILVEKPALGLKKRFS